MLIWLLPLLSCKNCPIRIRFLPVNLFVSYKCHTRCLQAHISFSFLLASCIILWHIQQMFYNSFNIYQTNFWITGNNFSISRSLKHFRKFLLEFSSVSITTASAILSFHCFTMLYLVLQVLGPFYRNKSFLFFLEGNVHISSVTGHYCLPFRFNII